MTAFTCARCDQPLGPTILRCPACRAGAHLACRPAGEPCPGCQQASPPVLTIPGRISAGVQLAQALPVLALFLTPGLFAVFVVAVRYLDVLPWFHPALAVVGGLLGFVGLIVGLVLARRRGLAYEGWVELHPDRAHVHKPASHPVYPVDQLTGYRLNRGQRMVRLQHQGRWTPVAHSITSVDDEGLQALLGWLDERQVAQRD